MISLEGGNKDAADFLSSFLNTYTNPDDASKPTVQAPSEEAPLSEPAAALPVAPAAMPAAMQTPLALLAQAPPLPPSGDDASSNPMDVDSLVSAFLARSG